MGSNSLPFTAWKHTEIESLAILKPAKISNLNHKLFISQESNIEKLVGLATLPPSFLPTGKLPF